MKFDSQISVKHEGTADSGRDSHANGVKSASSAPSGPLVRQIALAGVASLVMAFFVAAVLKTLA